ncbi:MAG: hypothetical protein EXR54_06460 [Dehalococcoidia bacterium]|nr:hypothetical protein [Dehalococcoidia bacterium]MSQ17195.1 hypothetical protein [Dehalococcoidia bacterium]
MVALTIPIGELGLDQAWESLKQVALRELSAALAALSAGLVEHIRQGTATPEEIDGFIKSRPRVSRSVKQALLLLTATLLLERGRADEALERSDAALEVRENSLAWYMKGAVLVRMDRMAEGFSACRTAYNLHKTKETLSTEILTNLLPFWSLWDLSRGLSGILAQDLGEMEKGLSEYFDISDKAAAEGLEDAVTKLLLPQNMSDSFRKGAEQGLQEAYARAGLPVTQEQVRRELQEALDELELAVRLLSIKNPFDRWRALTKEISKVWPEGVSALDAVREQRE